MQSPRSPQASNVQPISARLAEAALSVAFALVASWYSVAIPIGEGVDEVGHFVYGVYLRDHLSLPIQPWRDNGRSLEVPMGHHPPLYYILAAALASWVDTSDRAVALRVNPHFEWRENDPTNGFNVLLHGPAERFPYSRTVLAFHLLRLLSVALGMVTVVATYQACRHVVPSRLWVAVTAAALTAFNPAFVYMSSTIHNDPLMATVYALSLWWMTSTLARPLTPRRGLVGGALLAAGLLAKLTGLALAPLLGLTLLLVWRRDRRLGTAVRAGALIYGFAAIAAGWWYVRNQVLYGDPLGWQMLLGIFSNQVRPGPLTLQDFALVLLQVARTFWGAFGYMHITLPAPIWKSLWAAAGIAVFAGTATLIRQRREFLANGLWQGWLVLGAAVALVFVGFVRYTATIGAAGHARYFFTVIGPLTTLIGLGLHSVLGFRAPRAVTGAVATGMLAYAVAAPAIFVLPLYAPPETAQPLDLAIARPVGAVFGGVLELAAYRLDPEVVAPGHRSTLVLYWRAAGDHRPDLHVTLRSLDRFGNVFVEDRFWPVPASTTAVWDTSAIYVTRRTLTVPTNAARGRAPLVLQVQPQYQADLLPAVGAEGQSLGPSPAIAWIVVGQPSDVEGPRVPSRPHRGVVGDDVVLLGYDLVDERVKAGGTIELALYWQGIRRIDRNYTVFVHILDARGQLVAQVDNEPNGGQYPTSGWPPGKVVRDAYRVPLPAGFPPGRYAIAVGMYEWPSLVRLPVTLDGAAHGDSIRLADVDVE